MNTLKLDFSTCAFFSWQEGRCSNDISFTISVSKPGVEESWKYWQISSASGYLEPCPRITEEEGTAQVTEWERIGELSKDKLLFQGHKLAVFNTAPMSGG